VNSTSEKPPLATLMIGAIGVVFGDIGTSPLYTMKECFAGAHPLALDQEHVLGVLSLIFWSVMLVVSFKYVGVMMRADNRGEGGSLALLALTSAIAHGSRLAPVVPFLGIFAACLFYGDSMITPAISVLSAIEGLEVAAPALHIFVLPITVAILVCLFLIQRYGTRVVGALFGPIMCVWFTALAALGIINIAAYPQILAALNPAYAISFFLRDGWLAFLALGSVVLALTGAEALYADMGHFGRRPIRVAWFALILPALLLNYFGQGALLTVQPQALDNPFYRLAPGWAQIPLVVLATLATVVASQAVISGAFSVTRQAIQLGYLPRLQILHTSASEIGQVYIPFLNWTLLVAVVLLVLGFQTSSNLAAAYGVAVTGTMLIDTLLVAFVVFMMWRINRIAACLMVGLFLTVDMAFFLANATKIPYGGWFPLLIGLGIFVLLQTWKRGRELLMQGRMRDAMPFEDLQRSLSSRITRVAGTAVFLTGTTEGVPHALLHNLKHNKVLHERNVILTMQIQDVPRVPQQEQTTVTDLGNGFLRMIVRYGFMQRPDVPRALRLCKRHGHEFNMMETSFFLSRETVVPSVRPGMSPWRDALFASMSRNAASAMEFFELPTDRVVELGSQIEI